MKKNNNTNQKKNSKKYVFLLIVGIISAIIIFNLINKQLMKINDEKITSKLEELKTEEINYVFLEINPKFVLEVRDNKVISVGCLNDDCIKVYDELNVIGKNLIDSVDYIYNYLKEHKYNVNKAKVKVYKNFSFVSDKKHILVEVIDKQEGEKLLNEVINNDKIKKQSSKEKYSIKLWNELKQDKDYGKIYECVLVGEELECYIKKNLLVGFSITSKGMAKYLTKYDNIIPNLDGIARVLNKFGLKTKSEVELGLFRNPTYYMYVNGVEYLEFIDGDEYLSKNIYYSTTMNCNDYRFDLTSINLLKVDEIPNLIYLDKNGFVFEETTVENIVDALSSDIYGKKQIVKTRSFCENNTIKEDKQEGIYIIYRVDGSYSKEVTKAEYDDFNVDLGVFMNDVQECEFRAEIVDGKIYKVIIEPHNGKYCKYNDTIQYYSSDGYTLFEY
ncbi:MAG: hypothetical protein E7169_03100 [Firmicutes bacterium]|nr:hypothetical protein [Bacillota bacterium]